VLRGVDLEKSDCRLLATRQYAGGAHAHQPDRVAVNVGADARLRYLSRDLPIPEGSPDGRLLRHAASDEQCEPERQGARERDKDDPVTDHGVTLGILTILSAGGLTTDREEARSLRATSLPSVASRQRPR
jgi:hypothetical protein